MKALFYSPDSYGLGHVRRSTSVAEALLNDEPGASALLLTGAPLAGYFDYPRACNYLTLPPVTKDSGGQYVSRNPELHIDTTVGIRTRMIEQATALYRPEIMVVDHSPLGLRGEILPTLQQLGQRTDRCYRVLGMRDVIDEPTAVRAAWKQDGVIEALRRYYDEIFVYGQQDVFDPIEAYEIPADVASKVHFVGYIPRHGNADASRYLKQRFAPRTGRLVALTLGGGGDGDSVMERFCEAYERLGARLPFEVVAVTGPLMSASSRKRFLSWAEPLPGLSMLEYMPEMPDLFEAADFVVAMGGYNTVCELASAGAKALIIPRTFPRKEQQVRAQVLAERGVMRYLEAEKATPDTLIGEILEGLERPAPARGWGLDFNGLTRTAAALRNLVRDRVREPQAA